MPTSVVFLGAQHCLKRATLPALFVALGGLAGGQVVCYEGFEGYGATALLESGNTSSDGTGRNGGTGWGGEYDVLDAIKLKVKMEDRTSNPVSYANGDVLLPGGIRALRFFDNADGSYAVRRPMGTVFTAADGQTLWFSILFRTATGGAGTLNDQDLFQIGFDDNPNPDSGNPRVSIGSNTLSTTAFPSACHFFARSTTDPLVSDFYDTLPIAAATTYLLVCQIQPTAGSYNTVNLFVNPSSLDDPGPPSATITAASGLSTLSHAFIRTAFLDSGDAYVLDEWRIGKDYGSVVGSLRNALAIFPASVPGGSPTLSWPASLPSVVLETSTTLAPDSWELVAGSFSAVGGDSTYPVPITPGTPRRFYRLRR